MWVYFECSRRSNASIVFQSFFRGGGDFCCAFQTYISAMHFSRVYISAMYFSRACTFQLCISVVCVHFSRVCTFQLCISVVCVHFICSFQSSKFNCSFQSSVSDIHFNYTFQSCFKSTVQSCFTHAFQSCA